MEIGQNKDFATYSNNGNEKVLNTEQINPLTSDEFHKIVDDLIAKGWVEVTEDKMSGTLKFKPGHSVKTTAYSGSPTPPDMIEVHIPSENR